MRLLSLAIADESVLVPLGSGRARERPQGHGGDSRRARGDLAAVADVAAAPTWLPAGSVAPAAASGEAGRSTWTPRATPSRCGPRRPEANRRWWPRADPRRVLGRPVPLSLPGAAAVHPQVVLGGDGRATAVWFRATGPATYGLQSSTRSVGGAWTSPVDLPGDTSAAAEAALVVRPGASVVVAWPRTVGGLWSLSASCGRRPVPGARRSWSVATPATSSTEPAGRLRDLAVDTVRSGGGDDVIASGEREHPIADHHEAGPGDDAVRFVGLWSGGRVAPGRGPARRVNITWKDAATTLSTSTSAHVASPGTPGRDGSSSARRRRAGPLGRHRTRRTLGVPAALRGVRRGGADRERPSGSPAARSRATRRRTTRRPWTPGRRWRRTPGPSATARRRRAPRPPTPSPSPAGTPSGSASPTPSATARVRVARTKVIAAPAITTFTLAKRQISLADKARIRIGLNVAAWWTSCEDHRIGTGRRTSTAEARPERELDAVITVVLKRSTLLADGGRDRRPHDPRAHAQ